MKNPFITKILEKIVPKIGARIIIEPEYKFVGQIIFKNGNKTLYNKTSLDINGMGSAGISKDKGYAGFFLKQIGYPIPEGNSFFSEELNNNLKIKRTIDDGYLYARSLSFPVILKPNDKSKGILVTKVHNKREYYEIAKKIFRCNSVMIIQKFHLGKDYRIVVLDGKFICAYERIPLFVRGNGKDSVETLIRIKKRKFEKIGRNISINEDDYRIKSKLKRRTLTLKSVIPLGQKVFLLDNANLSSGGSALDVSHNIHQSFKNIAIKVSKDMGLSLCGVDILTDSIKSNGKYIILEINSAPSLHNFATLGKKQFKKVENVYLQILNTLENK